MRAVIDENKQQILSKIFIKEAIDENNSKPILKKTQSISACNSNRRRSTKTDIDQLVREKNK